MVCILVHNLELTRMANLRSLDLNLLTVFEAVYDTQNITEAAKRLGLTQSAASHALRRLREALRDDLFVRGSDGLKPTEAALSLYPAVRSALDGIRTAVAGKATFDPASARGSFRIAIPYVIGPFVALRLEERLKAEAPSVELHFDTRTIPLNLLSELEEGRTDVAVDWWTATEARFVNQHIFDDQLMIVVGRDHPRIREAPSLAALERENFVGLHRRPAQWDRALAIKQVLALKHWKIALNVSEFIEVPLIVAATDFVSVMPQSMASTLEKTGLVRLLPFPASLPPLAIKMTWHAGRRRDPGHMWLRRMVRQEVRRFANEALDTLPRAKDVARLRDG
jgi:LysR family transcriptional activator for leuABCD operon